MASIQMTLQSDLCTSSGIGYSSVIDIDVCRDNYGIPYIPSRRMKGCLREAAQYIGIDEAVIDRIFGVSGAKNSGSLMLGNGYLATYYEMIQDAQALEEKTGRHVDLSEAFTHTRARTAIDAKTDTAKDNTLRTMRVINRSLNGTDPLQFIFRAECLPEDEEPLTRICQAMRNIGLNRSRGFGAVRCAFLPGSGMADGDACAKVHGGDGDCRVMDVLVRFLDPVVVPGYSNEQCLNYIPGTALLGAMARLYLKEHASADDLFERLFLSGTVQYGNLYISDKDGTQCIPAPYFMRKLKTSDQALDGKVVTVFENIPDGCKHKPLKNAMVDRSLKQHEVLMETAYHHSRGVENLLYTQTGMMQGQYFRGAITGPREMLGVLEKLLCSHDLRLGRSKSAQYSNCQVVSVFYHAPQDEERIEINPGDKILFSLESDAILCDGDGAPAVNAEALLRALTPENARCTLDAETALGFRLIHGYNAKRNLRNMPMTAFAMGSVLAATAQNAFSLPRWQRVGLKTGEGYGAVSVSTLQELRNGKGVGSSAAKRPDKPDAPQPAKLFDEIIHKKEQREETLKNAAAIFEKRRALFSEGRISASLCGRLMLMVQQADDFDDYCKRAQSIKDAVKRDAVADITRDIPAPYEDGVWQTYLMTIFRLGKYSLKEGANV